MNETVITSAQYKNDSLTGIANVLIVAVIDGDTVYVPIDPANRHYIEIMHQVESGKITIADAD